MTTVYLIGAWFAFAGGAALEFRVRRSDPTGSLGMSVAAVALTAALWPIVVPAVIYFGLRRAGIGETIETYRSLRRVRAFARAISRLSDDEKRRIFARVRPTDTGESDGA